MVTDGFEIEQKGGYENIVTSSDLAVQNFLCERLAAMMPDSGFLCEEKDINESQHEYTWIIDPIDGTMNFVRGFHPSCISVAYAEKGRLCAAAVYNPYVDEMFSAVAGQGAYLNGRQIHVDDVPLRESVACFGTAPYDSKLWGKTFCLAEKVFGASLDLRRQGSAELDLCSVAAGRAGLYFELSVSLWDYAAGMLLVNQAGGRCCRTDGSPLPFDGTKTDIAAGSPQALADFLRLAGE